MKMINGTKNITCAHRFCCRRRAETLTSVIRADYADDEYIQELLKWIHPHVSTTEEVKYTEEENLVMLRLPRKECDYISSDMDPLFSLLIYIRSQNPDTDPLSLPHSRRRTFLVRIRIADKPA
jgi:hypothetical protein